MRSHIPALQPFASLLGRRTPRDPSGSQRRCTRFRVAAEHAGRVAVDVLREPPASPARARLPRDDAGEVRIHLVRGRSRPPAQQRVEVAGVNARRGDSKLDAGTHDDAMNQTSSGIRAQRRAASARRRCRARSRSRAGRPRPPSCRTAARAARTRPRAASTTRGACARRRTRARRTPGRVERLGAVVRRGRRCSRPRRPRPDRATRA